MLHGYFVTCLIAFLHNPKFILSENVTTTTASTTTITSKNVTIASKNGTTVAFEAAATTKKVKAQKRTVFEMSSDEPNFEDLLRSNEKRTGYYKFVQKSGDNGTDIIINMKVSLGKKKTTISDVDKRIARIEVPANNYQDACKDIIEFFSKLLNVKDKQLSFMRNEGESKTLKLVGYKKTRYRILYKIIEAWESAYQEKYNPKLKTDDDDIHETPFAAPCGRDVDCNACSLSKSTQALYDDFGGEDVRDLSKII